MNNQAKQVDMAIDETVKLEPADLEALLDRPGTIVEKNHKVYELDTDMSYDGDFCHTATTEGNTF